MRLIDAGALKEKRFRMHSEFLGAVSVVAVRDIDDAPTIDAVPVVHGTWVHDINNLYGCSECMKRETMSPKKLKPYCPNCGAKMDAD
jgi:hypothetical protein